MGITMKQLEKIVLEQASRIAAMEAETETPTAKTPKADNAAKAAKSGKATHTTFAGRQAYLKAEILPMAKKAKKAKQPAIIVEAIHGLPAKVNRTVVRRHYMASTGSMKGKIVSLQVQRLIAAYVSGKTHASPEYQTIRTLASQLSREIASA